MEGIINVLKPTGMTSFDVVSVIRRLSRERKVGHTGTLDPDAAGVLPVCIGRATKVAEMLTSNDKKYRTEIRLGIKTDTMDASGRVLAQNDVNKGLEEISRMIMSFVGEIEQIPPMYSALKVEGKKLCDLARKGIEVERKSRKVKIHSIDIVMMNKDRIIMDVHCSKGTYIRTLCDDIGDRLGCGAHMSFLLRTAAGNFSLINSHTLEELKMLSENGMFEGKLVSIEQAFYFLPKISLSTNETKRFITTGTVDKDIELIGSQDMVCVYNENDKMIAIGNVLKRIGGINNYSITIKNFKAFF